MLTEVSQKATATVQTRNTRGNSFLENGWISCWTNGFCNVLLRRGLFRQKTSCVYQSCHPPKETKADTRAQQCPAADLRPEGALLFSRAELAAFRSPSERASDLCIRVLSEFLCEVFDCFWCPSRFSWNDRHVSKRNAFLRGTSERKSPSIRPSYPILRLTVEYELNSKAIGHKVFSSDQTASRTSPIIEASNCAIRYDLRRFVLTKHAYKDVPFLVGQLQISIPSSAGVERPQKLSKACHLVTYVSKEGNLYDMSAARPLQ